MKSAVGTRMKAIVASILLAAASFGMMSAPAEAETFVQRQATPEPTCETTPPEAPPAESSMMVVGDETCPPGPVNIIIHIKPTANQEAPSFQRGR